MKHQKAEDAAETQAEGQEEEEEEADQGRGGSLGVLGRLLGGFGVALWGPWEVLVGS